MTSTTILGLSHFSLSNSSLVEVDVEMCSIANILSLRQKRSAKLTYIVEKDATEKMRRFSAKSPRGFIGALSFTIKSPFLQILSTESTESKIKTMPEILAPRSFKWYMVCSCTMLSSWENPIQTSTLQSINILVIFRKKSKTLISQQLSWAGKFSPWFCDPLGPTHHLIPLTQNRYVEVVLWEMDQLLRNVRPFLMHCTGVPLENVFRHFFDNWHLLQDWKMGDSPDLNLPHVHALNLFGDELLSWKQSLRLWKIWVMRTCGAL